MVMVKIKICCEKKQLKMNIYTSLMSLARHGFPEPLIDSECSKNTKLL